MSTVSKQTCQWSQLQVCVWSLQVAALNMEWAEAVWETTTKLTGVCKRTAVRKVFSQRSQISMDKRSRQWPVWNDLKSQDAAPKQKQQTFPLKKKKKRLRLNCYSLSDHHNESTARRGSKRKSEEHPVYINRVCVRPFILHQFPLCLLWRPSRCHTDLLLSPRPWVCLGKQHISHKTG